MHLSPMQLIQGPVTALLCVNLIAPPLPAIAQDAPATKHAGTRPPYESGEMHNDQRILHALNRFTFGPRPGDLEAVRSMGLDAWFNQQLHPATLDESVLNARLAQYPAMQSSEQQLLYRFPSRELIRQAMNGRADLPQDPVLNAVYQNQIDREAARLQSRQKKTDASPAPQPASPAPKAIALSAAMESMTGDGDTDKSESPNPMAKDPAQAESAVSLSPANPTSQPPADEALLGSIISLPPQQRVARLASMPQSAFDDFIKPLRPLQREQLAAGLSPIQKEEIEAMAGPERVVAEELIASRLTHDIYSNAQLQEVMTDFWLNHFNVYLRKNGLMPYYLVSYERDGIRPFALGKFEDLLESTAHSPAMLDYLDNASSIGPDSLAAERAKDNAWRRPANQKKSNEGLNENYARELMELHTVGVNGGYTQADVVQAARIFTGWTIDRPAREAAFQFNPNRHEPGASKVMGQKFKDHGEAEGRELLHFLATRPATAHFISRELAERFVSDDPPQSIIDRMAHTYLSSGGDISAVLKTMFHSPEFWSTAVYRAKVKTPLEYVVSAVRAGNLEIANLRPLANALRQMGMPIYGCVPPTGYSWQASAWVSTGALVDRMNFALSLAANRFPGINATWGEESAADAAPSPEFEEARLESRLVSGSVSVSTRSAVLDQFRQQSLNNTPQVVDQPASVQVRPQFRMRNASPLERQDQLLAGLLLGSPEFQRR
ncbi:MAG TPA: DUF1800 domain-containing protein [Terracidiphilus sp.]|nr:DUF1800 domain-containing protein [Terracidiphilus sp.]